MAVDTIKKLMDIELDVGATNWRVPGKNDNDTEYKVAKEAIFKRDVTCRFCGFRGSPDTKAKIKNNGMELHFLDGNGLNLEPDNLVMSCNMCRMCFNLDYAAEQKAILAFIPDMTQAQINCTVRSILYISYFVEHARKKYEAEKQGKPLEGDMLPDSVKNIRHLLSSCEAAYADIKSHSAHAVELLGTDRPDELGQAIMQYRKELENAGNADKIGAEIRTKFDMNSGGASTGDDKLPPLEDILYGIRLIPTQPGCDPKAWHPPTGTYITSLPKTWEEQYIAAKAAFVEAGIDLGI